MARSRFLSLGGTVFVCLLLFGIVEPNTPIQISRLKDFTDQAIPDDIYKSFNAVRFVSNEGQNSQDVLFSAKLDCGTVFFCIDSVVFQIQTPGNAPLQTEFGFSRKNEERRTRTTNNTRAFSIRYPNSRDNVEPIGVGQRSERVNFFHGNDPKDWIVCVPTFDSLIYHEIYPGIDLIFYDSGGRLKYEFHVKPHISHKIIRVEYCGIASLSIDENSNILASLDDGFSFVERAPISFQPSAAGRTPVSISFDLLSKTRFCYTVAERDDERPLIIDPLLYSTYIGGSDLEGISSVRLGLNGYLYLAGGTTSHDFPTTGDAISTNSSGDWDAFIVIFDANTNTIQYSTYFGGNAYDFISKMEIDATGDMIVAGTTRSANFPVTDGSVQKNYPGGWVGFVTKLDSTCTRLLFSTYIGGSGYDELFDMTVGRDGDIYLTGLTDSRNFPISPGAYQRWYAGGEDDVFLTKLASDGSRILFSTFLGGDSFDEAYCVRVDSLKNVYIGGLTSSYNFPVTPDAIQRVNKWSDEGFFIIFDSTGSTLKYSTYFGGDNADLIETLFIDDDGNIVFNGKSSSLDLPVTPGVIQPNRAAPPTTFDVDFFLGKYSPSENKLLWCTYLGGTRSEESWSMVKQVSKNIILFGETRSTDYPVKREFQQSNAGDVDIVITIIDQNAENILFSTYFGGYSDDRIIGSSIQEKKLFITGFTYSIDFPITSLVIQDSLNGDNDGFLAIFDLEGLISSVDRKDAAQPKIVLLGNDPNPYSTWTSLHYNAPGGDDLKFSIFSIKGELIEHRKLGRLPAGKHTHHFNGIGLPTGVYFYTISSKEASVTGKMVKVE